MIATTTAPTTTTVEHGHTTWTSVLTQDSDVILGIDTRTWSDHKRDLLLRAIAERDQHWRALCLTLLVGSAP